jgi:prepilin-type N-terminal cleavage/methylation domain-containing protein
MAQKEAAMTRRGGVKSRLWDQRLGAPRRWADERGVTLVELMVVVAIIAIIAAIAVALFQDLNRKARLGADSGTVASIRSAVALYYGKTNGLFPASLASINTLITPAPVFQCNVTPTYDPANGKITFTATIGNCP